MAVDLVEGELLEDMTDETEENVKVGGFVEAGYALEETAAVEPSGGVETAVVVRTERVVRAGGEHAAVGTYWCRRESSARREGCPTPRCFSTRV